MYHFNGLRSFVAVSTCSTSLFLRESIHCLIDCMIFLSPFPDLTRMSVLTVYFALNSYTPEFSAYRMLSFDLNLNGFKSRINRQLLNFKLKKTNFMYPFYGWGSTASRLEPLRGGSLLFTTKFPEIPGNCRLFLKRFPVCFNSVVSFSYNSMPCSGCSASHGVNPN